MQTQRSATPSFRRGGTSHWWHTRVMLVGSDSVVSRALQTYLRKEGYVASVTSEDLEGWTGAALDQTQDRHGRTDTHQSDHQAEEIHLVIIAPSVTGVRREALCQRLRSYEHVARIPILALHDAGDAPTMALTPVAGFTTGGAAGNQVRASSTSISLSSPESLWVHHSPGVGGSGPSPNPLVDASLSWPFRLREVLSMIDQLLAEARVDAGRTSV